MQSIAQLRSQCNNGTSRFFATPAGRRCAVAAGGLVGFCRNIAQRVTTTSGFDVVAVAVPEGNFRGDDRVRSSAIDIGSPKLPSGGVTAPVHSQRRSRAHASSSSLLSSFGCASSSASRATSAPPLSPAQLFALHGDTATKSSSSPSPSLARRPNNASTVVAGTASVAIAAAAAAASARSFVISSSPSCLCASPSSHRRRFSASSLLPSKQLLCHGHRYPRRSATSHAPHCTFSRATVSSVFASFTALLHICTGLSARRHIQHSSGTNMVWVSEYDVDPKVRPLPVCVNLCSFVWCSHFGFSSDFRTLRNTQSYICLPPPSFDTQ